MRVVAGIAAALLSISILAAAGAELKGTADRIVDGDTFWLCNADACTKIRLCGVNAPERAEPGYAEASKALSTLVKGKAVRCLQVGTGTVCDRRSRPTNRGQNSRAMLHG
jgi:micrococcal nuclease